MLETRSTQPSGGTEVVPVRILVAADNPSMRAVLRLVLEGAGPWEVIEGVNGEQVLELARTQTFSLIILDLAMPVMGRS